METVNLKAFRIKNNLSQQDIATLLEVSRPFISNVENGNNKLTEEKIDKLLLISASQHWDASDLVPAYTRLCFVAQNLPTPSTIQYDGTNPFGLDKRSIILIRHGRIGIDSLTAAAVKKIDPSVNIKWLISGDGHSFLDDNIGDHTEVDVLQDGCTAPKSDKELLLETVQSMKEELAETRTILLQILNEMRKS